jgi:hypothetical protein
MRTDQQRSGTQALLVVIGAVPIVAVDGEDVQQRQRLPRKALAMKHGLRVGGKSARPRAVVERQRERAPLDHERPETPGLLAGCPPDAVDGLFFGAVHAPTLAQRVRGGGRREQARRAFLVRVPSPIELELLALSDEEFEQLVFALVTAEHPEIDWRRVTLIRAPDGGVDVMLVGERGGRKIGWQGKHVREPHWVDWEESLDTAREKHEIDEITFVFPFNPTEKQLKTFEERLSRPHRDVAVERWTLAHLEDLCRKHKGVYERYLGRSTDSMALLERLDRTIRAGGKIEHGADLLDRLRAMSEQLDAKDPHFAVRVDAGAAGTPSPEWSVPPYMSLTLIVDGREIEIAFWTRAGSPVERPYFGFTDDDAGRAARGYARTELGAGRAVVLREGVWIGITSPLILKELSEQGIVFPGFDTGRVQLPVGREGGLRIEPGELIAVELVADPGGAGLRRIFTARPVLAEEPAKGEVVANNHGIHLSLSFFPHDEGVDYSLSFGWQLGAGDARDLVAAAEWLLAVLDGGCSLVLDEEPLKDKGQPADGAGELLRGTLVESLAFLRDLRLIEERTGIALALPPQGAITDFDLAAVETSAEILRTGRGRATFQRGTQRVPATEISAIAERRSGSTEERDVQYPIFGKTVTLGRGRYTLPKLKLADVQALSDDPFGPARVWLEAAGTDQMEFALIG